MCIVELSTDKQADWTGPSIEKLYTENCVQSIIIIIIIPFSYLSNALLSECRYLVTEKKSMSVIHMRQSNWGVG